MWHKVFFFFLSVQSEKQSKVFSKPPLWKLWKHHFMVVQLVLQKMLLVFGIMWMNTRKNQLFVVSNNSISHARIWSTVRKKISIYMLTNCNSLKKSTLLTFQRKSASVNSAELKHLQKVIIWCSLWAGDIT